MIKNLHWKPKAMFDRIAFVSGEIDIGLIKPGVCISFPVFIRVYFLEY